MKSRVVVGSVLGTYLHLSLSEGKSVVHLVKEEGNKLEVRAEERHWLDRGNRKLERLKYEVVEATNMI